jgi:hypothetical protein
MGSSETNPLSAPEGERAASWRTLQATRRHVAGWPPPRNDDPCLTDDASTVCDVDVRFMNVNRRAALSLVVGGLPARPAVPSRRIA